LAQLRVFLLFLLSSTCLAQIPNRVDLFDALKSADGDSAKAVIYNTIARTYVRKQPDSALFYFDLASETASTAKANLLMVHTLSFKSMTFALKGKLDSAQQNLKKAAKICLDNKLDSALHQVYFGLGNILESAGKLDESLRYAIMAMEYFEEKNYLKSLNRTRANISYIYLKINELEKAKDLILKSNQYYDQIGAYRQLMNGFSRLGTLFEKQGQFDSSIYYLKKAIVIADSLQDDYVRGQLILNTGKTYKNQKNYLKAKVSFKEAINILEGIQAKPGDLMSAYTGLMLSQIYLGENNLNQRYRLRAKNLELKVEELNQRKEYYYSLFLIDSLSSNYQSALRNYVKFTALKDSLFNDKVSEQLLDVEQKYETNKIRSEKELADERAALAEAKSEQNQLLFISALVIALLVIVAGIFYYLRLKQKRKAELIALELKESQKRLALEKQYRDSELKALKAQMNPHFIFNVLNSIQEFIVLNEKDMASEYLATFAELIRSYLHFSNQGHITIAEETETIKKYMQLESLRFGEKFTYNVSVQNKELSECKIPTMIIQPYVENAIKHGLFNKEGKQELSVSIRRNDDKSIQVNIVDNGIGREKAREIKEMRSTNHQSFALEATSNRLELLNQKFNNTIGLEVKDLKDDKAEAAGTEVILRIPILK